MRYFSIKIHTIHPSVAAQVPALGVMGTKVDIEVSKNGMPTIRQRTWKLDAPDKGHYELVLQYKRTADGGMRGESEQHLYIGGELKSSCSLVSNRVDE